MTVVDYNSTFTVKNASLMVWSTYPITLVQKKKNADTLFKIKLKTSVNLWQLLQEICTTLEQLSKGKSRNFDAS
jgi:hypothetical protein